MIRKLKQKYFPKTKPKYGKPLNSKPGYIIAYNKYGGYCIPLNVIHRKSPQIILAGKVHEEETIQAIKKYYNGGAIIHAGTFFGDFLPALPFKVYAFEPNKESFLAAEITIKINQQDNIRLFNYALGKESCLKKLKTKRDNKNIGGGSHIADDGDQFVEMKALDDLIDEEISVIHLDTEREEMNIIRGAQKLIKKYKPVLILESYDIEYLQTLGYKLIGNAGRNKIFQQ